MNYKAAGVDVEEADRGIARIVNNIKSTWPKSGVGEVKLDIGYFANVINLGDIGLATTIDGVGSKTMIAAMMDDYETIGIDCVANVVNDLICVGAKPISMLDYIGVDYANAGVLDDISVGLTLGAKEAGISITGGEISQLPDMISGFDLVGSGCGLVDLNKVIVGEDVEPRDAIIGLASSGVHSNGFTLARRIFFLEHDLDPYEDYGLEGTCLGDELLVPTAIYVREVLDLLDCIPVKALINITGDGLLNLNRIKANVGFLVHSLPDYPKIFDLIQQYGKLDDATMFQTFNMGIGFCVIVSQDYVDDVIAIMARHGRDAFKIGDVIGPDEYKTVHIPERILVGRGKTFVSTRS